MHACEEIIMSTKPVPTKDATGESNHATVVNGTDVQNKENLLKRFCQLHCAFAAATIVFLLFLPTAGASAQSATNARKTTGPSVIKLWNRVIAFQRASVAGASAEERAELASQRLSELPLNASATEIEARSVEIEDQAGVGLLYHGHVLFFLGENDLDKENGEKLDQVADAAIHNLAEALTARVEERSWPVIRAGLLYTVAGFVVLVLLCGTIWVLQSAVGRFLRKREGSRSLRVFRVDVFPAISATISGLTRFLAWLLIFILVYLWVTVSLRRFPYTAPWGERAGSYVLDSIEKLGGSILDSLPGLLMVILIFLVTRWAMHLGNLFFGQVISGRISLLWMDADVARATHRIVTAVLWVFAVVVAYPYIPGSQSQAFKGMSVFFGLVISLGSTGIINQVMSGMFVIYSRALKTGEWVRVNEIEGEVLEVGLLAAKVRTIEGKEVTLPNSLLVSTSTTNYTRIGHADGMILSATVTIGYNAPWRQVHALLELAAERTPNVRKEPKPYVIQRALSDFYVEYTLVTRLERESSRVDTISNLNAAIQDAFNEFGVQIMSPHYMVQPASEVVVPPARWRVPPSGMDMKDSES
jgi:small-conductance mechanosensitive channel